MSKINRDIINKITGVDIHIETQDGERKIVSYTNFIHTRNDEIFINPRSYYNPFYSLDLHIEFTDYDLEYYDDIKGEEKMHMNNVDVITKKVARQILSMIETICFSEEFKEYRVNNGSNGTRNLIIENIKKTYGIG